MMMGMEEDPENPAAVAGSIFVAVAVSLARFLGLTIFVSLFYRYMPASWYSVDFKRG